jgi:hypothetical protein
VKEWSKALLFLWLFIGTIAIAAPQDIDQYLEASAKFEALVSESAKQRKMPRLKEKQAADVIFVLSDIQRFLNSYTYQIKDVDLLMDICGKANAAVMSYALFNLEANLDKRDDPQLIALKVQKLMERNIQTFQDELARLQPFQIQCMATGIPLISEFVESLKPEEMTDVRRDGLKKWRYGVFGMYVGWLQSINNPQLSKSYRLIILQSLADTASAFAPSLQLPVRKQILDFAKSVQSVSSNDFHLPLAKIIQAMSDMSCEGLCAF